MQIFKCKMCGGTLEVSQDQSTAKCEYCGTEQTLPKLDDDQRVQMYDRANHYRRNGEFDKAMGIYEKILNKDITDAESYWSIVLCRFGIEYVEDPSTKKMIPTINRMQYTSIFDDEDYKSALRHADTARRSLYEAEASSINEIQKQILSISEKEEPFDVFICYKETDNNGRRTEDSVLANDLYHQLANKGYRVFFSRITLEDKLGLAYEPYIFSALNSSKVMIVLGTRSDYFTAVWVKNEWSRYLSLIKKGEKKILIPAYRNMDPYDLPEEFSHLQALDMSKLGFMQDLIRGIEKIISNGSDANVAVNTVPEKMLNPAFDALMKRANIFLNDGDWEKADEYFEKVLDLDPENGRGYAGKLCSELKYKSLSEIEKDFERWGENSLEIVLDKRIYQYYEKILKFGDDNLIEEISKYIEKARNKYIENQYEFILKNMEDLNHLKNVDELAEIHGLIKKYKKIEESIKKVEGNSDVKQYKNECKKILENLKKKSREIYSKLPNISCVLKTNDFNSSFVYLNSLGELGYRYLLEPEDKDVFNENDTFGGIVIEDVIEFTTPASNISAILAVKSDGTVVNVRSSKSKIGRYSVSDWTDIVSVKMAYCHTMGLKSDGTVVVTKEIIDDESYRVARLDLSDWQDIVSIYTTGSLLIGMKSDGTVVATASLMDGDSCDDYNLDMIKAVSDWTDIVSIYTRGNRIIGLKSDGTVVATGDNRHGELNVSDWTDIVSINLTHDYTMGLKSDGTVVATGENEKDVSGWTDIVSIQGNRLHTFGIKADGTAVVNVKYAEEFEGFLKDVVYVYECGNFSYLKIGTNGRIITHHDDDFDIEQKEQDFLNGLSFRWLFSNVEELIHYHESIEKEKRLKFDEGQKRLQEIRLQQEEKQRAKEEKIQAIVKEYNETTKEYNCIKDQISILENELVLLQEQRKKIGFFDRNGRKENEKKKETLTTDIQQLKFKSNSIKNNLKDLKKELTLLKE